MTVVLSTDLKPPTLLLLLLLFSEIATVQRGRLRRLSPFFVPRILANMVKRPEDVQVDIIGLTPRVESTFWSCVCNFSVKAYPSFKW